MNARSIIAISALAFTAAGGAFANEADSAVGLTVDSNLTRAEVKAETVRQIASTRIDEDGEALFTADVPASTSQRTVMGAQGDGGTRAPVGSGGDTRF